MDLAVLSRLAHIMFFPLLRHRVKSTSNHAVNCRLSLSYPFNILSLQGEISGIAPQNVTSQRPRQMNFMQPTYLVLIHAVSRLHMNIRLFHTCSLFITYLTNGLYVI
jgi:hypothetical protein